MTGDLDRKFWFGIQPSDAADRFGVTGNRPNYLEYYFDSTHLPGVELELNKIKEELGDFMEKFDKRFAEKDSYTEEDLAQEFDTTKEEIEKMLRLYADYDLGTGIRDCIKESGSCEFDAEC